MVDTVNETAPDPEDIAEEEGGSGMPMTASEIVAEDEDDTDDGDNDDADDSDAIDSDEDEDEASEPAA